MEIIRLKTIESDAPIGNILDYAFFVLSQSESVKDEVVEWDRTAESDIPLLVGAILQAYRQVSPKKIIAPWIEGSLSIFSFDGQSVLQTDKIHSFEDNLRNHPDYDTRLNTAISYLFDELICNIQQHAMCHDCLLFAGINPSLNSIDICISDNGISLYGSYAKSGKYTDMLGNDSVSALFLAKDGFSTKNRPDAENRGYGISSNLKMVVDGLKGTLALISGNALYINTGEKQVFVNLPKHIEWQGTTIVARIPNKFPESFNLYDYIS